MIKHKLNYNSPTCMYSTVATGILLLKKKHKAVLITTSEGKWRGIYFNGTCHGNGSSGVDEKTTSERQIKFASIIIIC